MKVLVLGAGVIGVTTSYYLAKAGFEVTVIDRQPGAGLETSFGNAGEVSPGSLNIAAISSARCALKPASPMTSAARARCNCSASSRSSTAPQAISKC